MKTLSPRAVRILGLTSYGILCILLMELTCQLAYRISFSHWRLGIDFGYHEQLFEPHPYLVGAPRASVQVEKHDVVLVSGNGGILDHHSTLILSPHPA